MQVEQTLPGALALTWLVTTTGCMLEDGEVDARNGQVVLDSTAIPGGGPCKRCVRGVKWAGGSLHLCVDTSVKYIRAPRVEGPPLLEMLIDGDEQPASRWGLASGDSDNLQWADLCGESPCVALLREPVGKNHHIVEIPLAAGVKPLQGLQLVFTEIEQKTLDAGNSQVPNPGMLPRLELRDPGAGESPCGPDFKEPPNLPAVGGIGSTYHLPSVAQISFAWDAGGVRSCSGVLISKRHVLTAAHCFDQPFKWTDDELRDRIEVHFGGNRQAYLSFLGVAGITRHDDYTPGELDADVAVVTLESDVDATVAPVQFVTKKEQLGGWLARGYGTQPSKVTMAYDWGEPKLHNELQLAKSIAGESTDDHRYILTSADKSSPPLCQGDSGGPVLRSSGGNERLVAILAARIVPDSIRTEAMGGALAFNHGNACGATDQTLGYIATRVDTAAMLAWIDSVVSPPGIDPPGPILK